jgi:hypothetical protein
VLLCFGKTNVDKIYYFLMLGFKFSSLIAFRNWAEAVAFAGLQHFCLRVCGCFLCILSAEACTIRFSHLPLQRLLSELRKSSSPRVTDYGSFLYSCNFPGEPNKISITCYTFLHIKNSIFKNVKNIEQKFWKSLRYCLLFDRKRLTPKAVNSGNLNSGRKSVFIEKVR